MTKSVIAQAILIATLSLAGTSSTVWAESPSPRDAARPVKAMMGEARGAKRDARFERVASRVEKRMQNHEQQLNNLISRVEARATKMEQNDRDMSYITQARTHLATAKTQVAEAVALKTAAISALRAIESEKWSDQDTEVRAAKDAVIAAQKAFVKPRTEIKTALQLLAKAAGETSRARPSTQPERN